MKEFTCGCSCNLKTKILTFQIVSWVVFIRKSIGRSCITELSIKYTMIKRRKILPFRIGDERVRIVYLRTWFCSSPIHRWSSCIRNGNRGPSPSPLSIIIINPKANYWITLPDLKRNTKNKEEAKEKHGGWWLRNTGAYQILSNSHRKEQKFRKLTNCTMYFNFHGLKVGEINNCTAPEGVYSSVDRKWHEGWKIAWEKKQIHIKTLARSRW